MENPIVVLVQIVRAFERLDIDYVVVGSVASSIHGEYRASGDIDIIADLELRHVSALVEILKDEFYVDGQTIRRAIEHGRSFNIIHLTAIFKVDIFVPGTELAKQQLIRRQPLDLGSPGHPKIWIATAEDTILAKLHWYRLGNEISQLQWRDVRGIIGTRGETLDRDYLDQWAQRLDVSDLLSRALAESR
jgi:hypothetical protein